MKTEVNAILIHHIYINKINRNNIKKANKSLNSFKQIMIQISIKFCKVDKKNTNNDQKA